MTPARARLSAMMFLEFFIWGAWLELIFGYLPSLGYTDSQQSWILNAFPIGSLVAMFFSTQYADRNFAAQKFVSFSHLVGGLAILALFWVPANEVKESVSATGEAVREVIGFDSAPLFLTLMLVHCLFYVPTISITNTIAFTHLQDAQKEFGRVRLWGTIGWIAASWPFIFILVDWAKVPAFGSVGFGEWVGAAISTGKQGPELLASTRWAFVVAGAASLALAGLSLGLPHTPPKPAAAGSGNLAWLEAMKLLRVPFVLVLFVVTFLDAAVHQGYFMFTNEFLKHVGVPGNWSMPVMKLGQMAEIGTMMVLGAVLKRLGWRTTMILGILGHGARFTVFALFPHAVPASAVILVHGVCYAFFFATVYIFVDEFFPKDVRSSAQGLFNFMILGAGPFAANIAWKSISERFKDASGQLDYSSFFLVPATTAFAAALFLFFFFRPPASAASASAPAQTPH